MTNTYTTKQLLSGDVQANSQVEIKGWVRSRRDSKAGISFLNIYDGSCFAAIQAVVPQGLDNYQSDVLKLTAGCSVSVKGILVESQGKGQQFEIQATAVDVIGWVDDPDSYPIAKKRHTLEYLREVAHLRPRTNTLGAMTRIRSCLSHAIHDYFYKQGFYCLSTPVITASDCEGAGEMFRVSSLDLMNLPRDDKGGIDFSQDFFGRETFLTVSGQLEAETYCCALSKVYTFGPTFRAENSNTSRHLAEFWMLEPEIAFADIHDDIRLADSLLKYVLKQVLNDCADDMTFFAERVDKTCIERLENVIKTPIETMTYTDAIEKLKASNKKFEFSVEWGIDLQTEHERYLCEEIIKGPVALIDYPKTIKPFYMRVNDDEKTVAAMDILVPGVGELVGGSQREERLDKLDQRMAECHIDPKDYQWYRDLRRYGTVPHAGFGLGFERLVRYVTGLANIRDVIMFPRTPGSAEY
ncbi:MAG: asparagine--tRNA ligase [Gammaproteobacteria bacterium]|nr:asparagine--tRNA ligase [Gammaproteobacteria bacterium]